MVDPLHLEFSILKFSIATHRTFHGLQNVDGGFKHNIFVTTLDLQDVVFEDPHALVDFFLLSVSLIAPILQLRLKLAFEH